MIHSLAIKGYRGFGHFEMGGLASINLLVGKNNGGKTSVLEALYLLASGGDPLALWRVLSRRGERLDNETTPRGVPEIELDITHLFNGHEARPGANFSLSTRNGVPHRSLVYEIKEGVGDDPAASAPRDRPEPPGRRPVLAIAVTPNLSLASSR